MIHLESGETYLDIDEAAKILNVTSGRVWHFLTDRRLDRYKLLNRTVLLESDVREFAQTRRLKPGPVPKSD